MYPAILFGKLCLLAVLLCPAGSHAAVTNTEEPGPLVLEASVQPAPVQGWHAFHLSRALSAWADDDLQRVIDELSAINVKLDSEFEQADRAAFLLAEALLRLGDTQAFLDLARHAADPEGSAYRQWLAWRALESGSGFSIPEDYDAAPLLGAALMMEEGHTGEALALLENHRAGVSLRALHLHLLALAQESNAVPANRTWQKLSSLHPESQIDFELVWGAHLALGIAALEAGENPVVHLQAVSPSSQRRSRALHMLALIALEEGRVDDARAALDELLAREEPGATRRAALLLRGQLKMDQLNHQQALALFETAERDWESEWSVLQALQDSVGVDNAWAAWERGAEGGLSIRYRAENIESLAARAVTEALDLRHDDDADLDSDVISTEIPDSRNPLYAHQPSATELTELDAVLSAARRLDVERARLDHEIEESEANAQRRLRYLQTGTSRTSASLDEMDRTLRALEARLAELDLTLAAMDSLQADATARILASTRRLVTELDRDRLFLRALHHFHVDGPQRRRNQDPPDGATADSVIEAEAALAAELSALASLFADRMPALVDRSFDEILEPQLASGSRTLYARLLAERARGANIFAALDSLSRATVVSPVLLAQRDSLRSESVALARQESELRSDVAQRVALRGRATLAAAREALDYHLADASFEHAISLALDPATSEVSDIVQPARETAMHRLESFLARHPESFARGESRFRLADLRLLQARDDFQMRMASFLGEQPDDTQLNDRALAPFVDYAPAIELYRAILDTDPDFAHIDAVLFSLGMILSDDGQAEGVDQLARLVQEHPLSRHAQEAWLRLGDDRFESKDFAVAVPMLENAAGGGDPTFAAIALYKLGWAHFEQDQFLDAADGFRRLMDLYTQHEGLAASTDLRDEAEEYLVHSLSRGGGADEFGPYFDALGGRNYESRVLATMGALLKSYSLYDESIACDQLWLERYPDDSRALNLALRMVDSYGRWNKSDSSRQVRLELAPRFMAGASWYDSHPDQRAEADAFAQAGYRDAALHWHHQARASQEPADWSRALDHYENFLAHWPSDPESARLHYQAGDAASQLARYDRAIEHFTYAAADTASFADDAAWQRVATADRWYQSEIDTTSAVAASGPDSLATRVLTLGDEYLGRHPDSEYSADLLWRQAQLAYLHDWNGDAADRFGDLAKQHPRDKRVPLGLRLRGDAFHRSAEYREAALAYEDALAAARTAGQDSLATTLEPIIPLSYYEHAESLAATDSTKGERDAAPHFVELAQRFPDFERADQSLYRGALGYLEAGDLDPAVEAFAEVLRVHPQSDHARDAAVQIAQAYEDHDRNAEAADAWASYSRSFPEDSDGPAALLRAADLQEQSGKTARAEDLQSEFLRRYPGEFEAALEIREARATRELDSIAAGGSGLAALLRVPGAGASAPGSELSAYLALAAAHPESASPLILAHVDFLKAEEIYPSYAVIELTQPLPASIESKKARLEKLLEAYGRCTQHQVKVYTQASAHRIGEALIAFGDALIASERPSGLTEDEMFAYDEVLDEQGWGFFDRGEQAWNELLQQNLADQDDEGGWIARTREALWPRVARRFVHQPTVEYPLVAANPPSE